MAEVFRNPIDDYLTNTLSVDLLNSIDETRISWPRLESTLGEVYFSIANFFGPPDAKVDGVRIIASNFRGLFQSDGRATELAVFGKLREVNSNLSAHKNLHIAYMRALSRRYESINQLFLALTELRGISIYYAGEGNSRIDLDDSLIAKIKIGSELSQLWKSTLPEWSSKISSLLANSGNKIETDKLTEKLTDSRKEIVKKLNDLGAQLLTTDFFRDWMTIPHKENLTSTDAVAQRFNNWILSLAWLSFYCQDSHGGKYFYSVRLPNIFAELLEGSVFPSSSLSIVACKPLNKISIDSWFKLSDTLVEHEKFSSLIVKSSNVFSQFVQNRKDSYRFQSEDDGEKLAHFISKNISDGRRTTKDLPIDWKNINFLLRMSRLLVDQKHEGHDLHFCFILGFSWERVDSESRGTLKEFVSGLSEQWEKFYNLQVTDKGKLDLENRLKVSKISRTDALSRVAEGMQKWIKTGDLPLQPWDLALFFEEWGDKQWPMPTSIVQMENLGESGKSTVSTGYQLRNALETLTKVSESTVAVLVVQRGLLVFAGGKTIMMPCASGLDYASPIRDIGLSENLTDDDRLKNLIDEALNEGNFSKAGKEARIATCKMLRKLCSALVSLNHGAMIIIQAPTDNVKEIPPLNPAWHVKPGSNGPSTDEGILFYALMAALDGATEIHLPKDDGPILFSVRKSVNLEKSVWKYDKEGFATISEEFKDLDKLELVGKGTRHHSALALSKLLSDDAIILTVSADGPVNLWQNGKRKLSKRDADYRPRFL